MLDVRNLHPTWLSSWRTRASHSRPSRRWGRAEHLGRTQLIEELGIMLDVRKLASNLVVISATKALAPLEVAR